ncbi:hypothetical protein ACW2AB_11390 [Limosilactobacillus fermentum]
MAQATPVASANSTRFGHDDPRFTAVAQRRLFLPYPAQAGVNPDEATWPAR